MDMNFIIKPYVHTNYVQKLCMDQYSQYQQISYQKVNSGNKAFHSETVVSNSRKMKQTLSINKIINKIKA